MKENDKLKGCHVEILSLFLFVAASQEGLRYAVGINYAGY